jgi:cobalamin synthase
MKNSILRSELVLSLILVGLTLLFLNPFQKLWMPTMFMSLVLLAFIVAFILLAGIIWKETTGDEREQLHRQVAGRISFLVGTGLLVTGIIVQTLQHQLDPWLLIVLCGMVITKLIARLYKDSTN